MAHLGVKVKNLGKGKFSFKADQLDLDYLESQKFKEEGSSLRGSIMIVGPLLPGLVRGISLGQVGIRSEGADWIPTSKDLSNSEPNSGITAKNDFYGVDAPDGLDRNVYAAGSGFGYGYGQYRHGSGAGKGYDHHLQRCLRALSATVVPYA